MQFYALCWILTAVACVETGCFLLCQHALRNGWGPSWERTADTIGEWTPVNLVAVAVLWTVALIECPTAIASGRHDLFLQAMVIGVVVLGDVYIYRRHIHRGSRDNPGFRKQEKQLRLYLVMKVTLAAFFGLRTVYSLLFG